MKLDRIHTQRCDQRHTKIHRQAAGVTEQAVTRLVDLVSRHRKSVALDQIIGKMIVEGYSAGRNFRRNLISASPSSHASKPLEADATERANARGSIICK